MPKKNNKFFQKVAERVVDGALENDDVTACATIVMGEKGATICTKGQVGLEDLKRLKKYAHTLENDIQEKIEQGFGDDEDDDDEPSDFIKHLFLGMMAMKIADGLQEKGLIKDGDFAPKLEKLLKKANPKSYLETIQKLNEFAGDVLDDDEVEKFAELYEDGAIEDIIRGKK